MTNQTKQLVLIKEFNIPILMNKNQMMTVNNYAKIHWAIKSKLKNEYKKLLTDWFIDGSKIPEVCHMHWTPTYKDKRRRDSINLASVVKLAEDVLVEAGSMRDDNQTTHTLYPGSFNTALSNNMLNVKIYAEQDIF
jgi:hypothetical protein